MNIILTLLIGLFTLNCFAQNAEELPGVRNIDNVVIVGQLDQLEDRYSLEINLTQLFKSYGIKTNSSLNIVKQGGDTGILATDSLQTQLKEKGFDTYMLISVRGYDKKFKKSTSISDFKTEINAGHLFALYREEIVSVTFEIIFFKDGKALENRLIKVGSVGSRETVIKKLVKKLDKKIRKNWKKV